MNRGTDEEIETETDLYRSFASVPSNVKKVHPAYLMRRCPRGVFVERFKEQIKGKLLGFYSLL